MWKEGDSQMQVSELQVNACSLTSVEGDGAWWGR